MTALIGSINHFVTASAHASSDVFITIYNLLNTYGNQIGVRRIAFSTGTNGQGMDFPGSINEAGNNAWACFFFENADAPFFALLQFATSSGATFPFGNESEGAQGTLQGNSSYVSQGGVGLQIAGLPFAIGRDMDIWAGSRVNVGSDKKNSPCPWITSSGDVVVFPRANNDVRNGFSVGGSNPLSRSMYTCLVSQNEISTSSIMWHTLADANTLMFLKTYGSSSSSYAYSGMYFGPYIESVGFNSDIRYVMINHLSGVSSDPPFHLLASGAYYGSPEGTSSLDGGIAHPKAESGSFSVALDIPTFISASRFQQSNLFASATLYPIFDEYPIAVSAYDPAAKVYGLMGFTRFVRMTCGLPTHTILSESFRAVFGNSALTSSVKLTVPWPTAPPDFAQYPGESLSLTGTQVFFDATY